MTPHTLDLAIVQTLAYADVFNFPMTAAEVHHFLIGHRVTCSDVQQALGHPSAWLCEYVQVGMIDDEPYYALQMASPQIFLQRQQRKAISAILWQKAERYGAWLGRLPFVRMVAITGALSVQNVSNSNDDLDYILVVQSGRVWLARLFAVALVRYAHLWRVTLCPNYVLATEAMAQSNADLFLAHEITQMIPLVGHDLYQDMRALNGWAIEFLPNATKPFYPTTDQPAQGFWAVLKQASEWLLGGALGNRLEQWEMHRKVRKFESHLQDNDEVKLDAKQVKGHFMMYGQMTLSRYHARLTDLNLMAYLHDQSSAAD